MTATGALRRRSYIGLDLSLLPGVTPARLRVEAVDAGSPAAEAALLPGDELLALEGEPVTGLASARSAVARLSTARPALLLLQRGSERLEQRVQAVSMPLEALPSGRVELAAVPWAQHRLRAIWTVPDAAPPYPVIWLLPGATWLSEERCLPPGGSLLELVRGFTRAGFATLRVDRSGVGDSEGPACDELDLDAELDGWRATLAYLERHAWLAPAQLFIYARSLGGMLAPLVARSPHVRAIALWGTSARRWSRSMLEASRRQYTLAGARGAPLEHALTLLERLSTLLYDVGLTPEQAFAQRPELRALENEAFRGDRIYLRHARFFQQLARVDIAAAWREIACPVLSLHGSADYLGFAEHAAEIAALAPRGLYRELAGIDHFMHVRGSIEESFANAFGGEFNPAGLEAVVGFLREQR
jgi:pimeloyl-ACP methyl ester carboxylesterase